MEIFSLSIDAAEQLQVSYCLFWQKHKTGRTGYTAIIVRHPNLYNAEENTRMAIEASTKVVRTEGIMTAPVDTGNIRGT